MVSRDSVNSGQLTAHKYLKNSITLCFDDSVIYLSIFFKQIFQVTPGLRAFDYNNEGRMTKLHWYKGAGTTDVRKVEQFFSILCHHLYGSFFSSMICLAMHAQIQ